MLRAMHTAASGMISQQLYVDTIAHNLANINTVGFKKNRAHFEDLFYQTLSEAGSGSEGRSRPSPLQVGHGTRLISSNKLHTQGSTVQTGNPLDILIEGEGFFQFRLPDGTRGYSRDGSLSIDADGNIVNGRGYILEPAIAIPSDATAISVGADGRVSARISGEEEITELGEITLVRFMNASGLEAIGGNMYRATAAAGDPIEARPGESGLGSLSQGYLEMSNVQVVEEMVNMIVAQRAFEVSSKAIQTSDEMLRIANNVR
jgi:flagellar basal-body rod protein FlgG